MNWMKVDINAKTIQNFIAISFVVLVVGIITLQTLGCISFSAVLMKPVFFASNVFLGLICIYECDAIKEDIKFPLCGILCGTIFYVHEAFFSLLIFFVINIIWDRVATVRKCDFVFDKTIKLFFCSMLVLEMYSICVLNNEYLYNNIIETALWFKYIDMFFVFSLVLYVLRDKQKEGIVVSDDKKLMFKKRRHVEMTRISICCVLIVTIVFAVFNEWYSEINASTKGLVFYFGKTMNGGFFMSEDGVSELVCYTRKLYDVPGGVVENPAAFQWIFLEGNYFVQKCMLYIMKYICQFIYGVYGVVFMGIITMSVLIHKFVKFRYKRVRRKKVKDDLRG